jgi:adenylosuccinate lyase
MSPEANQSPLYERYASREMAAIFSPERRYGLWREIWIALAHAQADLGLPISEQDLSDLSEAKGKLDLERVRELEKITRHDVVAHLRHFAEQAGEAGGRLHLGATSAFVTDNADLLMAREAMQLLTGRVAGTVRALAEFAANTKAIPTLAFTHFQPAQLTTVGKRACLWIQDFLTDLEDLEHLLEGLRCRGTKGTTGTQASYLTLFDGDHDKVSALDESFAQNLGFAGSYPVTGQTYPRKLDSKILAVLSGIAQSAHKFGTDLRLLQGLGELQEPFDEGQVGSSAMAYKRNPIRAERMCALARRLITDSLNGPLTASTQWLERSLDDSANRRLVIPESFLIADALSSLAGGIAANLTAHEAIIRTHVDRELPFMASESLLMLGTMRGADRQDLHERLRVISMEAHEAVAQGGKNDLVEKAAADPHFKLVEKDVVEALDPHRYVGRAPEQVTDFLRDFVEPTLERLEAVVPEQPRI